MFRTTLRQTVFAGTLLLGGIASAQEVPSADTVLATVNGETIRLGHVAAAMVQVPAQFRQMPPQALFEGITQQLIQQTLLAQKSSGEVTGFEKYTLENDRRGMLASGVMDQLLFGAVKDEDLQNLYQQTYVNEQQGPEYNASHILVKTEAEAQALKVMLDGGADFADLAKTHSTGPSGPNGGELGWFGAGAMVPAFEEAVMALSPGGVSGPIKTQFGWHVVKLNETRLKSAPAFEDVRDELMRRAQNDVVQKSIEDLSTTAKIDVKNLADFDAAAIISPQFKFD